MTRLIATALAFVALAVAGANVALAAEGAGS